MNTRLEGNTILLCCGKNRCPSISKDVEDKGKFLIKDDFGGVVKLEKDQLLAIREALDKIDDI
jgi:hypothetical protein